MGKIVRNKIKGMSLLAKVSLISLFTFLVTLGIYQGWQMKSHAAIAGGTWSSVYAGTAFPATAGYTYSVAAAAGTNRLLVVAVSSTLDVASAQTCTVTWGGQTLTQATGDGGTSRIGHTYIFYLKDAGIVSATNSTLIATVTGGVTNYNFVRAAVYTGVDQTAAITTATNKVGQWTSAATATTTVGPLTPTLTIPTGGQAVEIANIYRASTASARTITLTTPWTALLAGVQGLGTTNASYCYINGATTAGSAIGSKFTPSGTTMSSMAAMVITPLAGNTLTVPTNLVLATGTKLDTDAGVPMQRLTLTATGALEINSLTLDDLGTAYSIDAAEVYISSTNSPSTTILPVDAVLIGSLGTGVSPFTAWGGTSTPITLAGGTTANRTFGGTEPLTKYIYIVYDMSAGQSTKTVQSSVTAVGVVGTANIGYTGSALSSNLITLAFSGNTVQATAKVLGASAAKDSDTGVVMQHFTVNSNSASDNALELNGITLNDSGTATQIASVKIYISTSTNADQTVLPAGAVQVGQLDAWNKASTTITLNNDYGATAGDRTLITGTPKYIYIVYSMFYPDDAAFVNGATVINNVTGVGAASPDAGATGLAYASNTISLTRGTWSKITSCGGCHVTDNMKDAPSFRNQSAGRFPGSHYNHATTSAIACSKCHPVPVVYNHASGFINFSGELKGDKYSRSSGNKVAVMNRGFNGVDYTFGTCSGTSCHGSPSPVWGSNSASDVDTCTKCHNNGSTTVGATNSSTDLQKAPATGAHTKHLSSTIARSVACQECHPVITSVTSSGHMSGVVNIYYNGSIGTTNTAPNSSAYPASCGTNWCHGGYITSLPQNKPSARIAPIWTVSFGTLPSILGDAHGLTSTNTGSGRCAQCHGYPPATASHAGTTLSGGSKDCNICHTNLRTDGTFVDPTLHINGIVEGGSCTACHDTGGTGNVNGRAAITPQFNTDGNSHHYQSATAIDGKTCYACHWEADSAGNQTSYHAGTAGGTVDLVIWNSTTRPVTYTDGTTSIAYVSGGTAATNRAQTININKHCLGCHSTPNAAVAPFTNDANTTSKYSPESRLGLANTSVQSRYSSTKTVPWSNYSFTNSSGNMAQYGTNKKSTITKALSAHGNAASNVMPKWNTTWGEDESMPNYTYTGTSGKRNVLCFDCHNSHGTPAAGITSSYSSATGRYKGGLLKSTTANVGGYTATYTPASRTINYRNYSTVNTTAAVFNAGASLCNDCHINGNPRGLTLTKPWNILTTYSSTQSIVGYWSTPYFDNYTVSPVKRNPSYKGGGAVNGIKDMRKPMGGHFGSSINSTAGSAGYPGTAGPTTGSVAHSGEINGLCTPCHDPHGISSSLSATARGKSVPLLKGTWVTSPYREDFARPAVKRGGGSKFAGVAASGSMAGYNIDQNTLINQGTVVSGASTATARGNVRSQIFTTFPGAAGNALGMHTEKTPADFAGLCIGCHAQATLTNATAPSAANWMSKDRVHQTVAGWAATSGTNANGTVHAYTCSKCHAPHVSRLPRLLVTNCLDARHAGQKISGSISSAAAAGTVFGFANNLQNTLTTSALGAGRFPAGGGRYSGTPNSAQNPGPWYFNITQAATASYGSNCHNATAAGGATYDPAKQIWNKKTRW